MAKTNFQSVDEYIAACPPDSQAYLCEIRRLIHVLAPDAKEKISYQIGAFELNGKGLLGFAGWKKHVSIYTIPSGSESFNKRIAPYTDGKGTLKFPLDKPLPIKLIEQVIKLHVKANLKRAGKSNYERRF